MARIEVRTAFGHPCKNLQTGSIQTVWATNFAFKTSMRDRGIWMLSPGMELCKI